MQPFELLAAHPWKQAAFTTYTLSLSFFEACILDALVRGGAKEAIIFSDVSGVRGALGEMGAQHAGRDYEVEPIAVKGGVFHPKISVLASDDECHVLVGSGNLTFGGWGSNLEVIEHLHPSFAADAFEDTAVFFELLAANGRLSKGAHDRFLQIAGMLRPHANGQPRNGDIRMIHSLDVAIGDQIVQFADELGGASRLAVAAPYWDGGHAIDTFCNALGLDHVFAHVHDAGTVMGFPGSNWPTDTDVTVRPVAIDALPQGLKQKLHGKMFELVCRRGRIIVSGSANATTAALGANHNVEACVLRVQREPFVAWRFDDRESPAIESINDDEKDDQLDELGVLRAVLDGDFIRGHVLIPAMRGHATVFQVSGAERKPLGEAEIEPDGAFKVSAPRLDVDLWLGSRLIIRLENELGQHADGFVSDRAYSLLKERTGRKAASLLALMARSETPLDIAALMDWLHENADELDNGATRGIGGSSPSNNDHTDHDATVNIAELESRDPVHISPGSGGRYASGATWANIIGRILASFREPRGSLAVEQELPDQAEHAIRGSFGDLENDSYDKGRLKAFEAFETVLDLLLSDRYRERHALTAFDLTHYICSRLEPRADQASRWLQDTLRAVASCDIPSARRVDIAAVVMTFEAAREERSDGRWARGMLRRIGYDLDAGPPSHDASHGFQSVFVETAAFDELWPTIRSVKTYAEQARSYVDALRASKPNDDYEELLIVAGAERTALEKAILSQDARDRIFVVNDCSNACPKCSFALPVGEQNRLRLVHVAKAGNCCGRVVIWLED